MLCCAVLQFQPPFSGQDPVEAARQAALYERRPDFVALVQPSPVKKVRGRGGALSCQPCSRRRLHPGWGLGGSCCLSSS